MPQDGPRMVCVSSTTRMPLSGGSTEEVMPFPLVLAGFGRPAGRQGRGVEDEGTAIVGEPNGPRHGRVIFTAEVDFGSWSDTEIGGGKRAGERRRPAGLQAIGNARLVR